jgi:UDP-glucose 6-dehydrogenase
MKIGIIGINDFSLAYGLVLINSGFDVVFYDNNYEKIFNLKNKVYITSEDYIQSMLLSCDTIITEDDTIELIKNCDTLFYFINHNLIDYNYNITSLDYFIDELLRASNLDILLYNKNFIICSDINIGDFDNIKNRLNQYSINLGYLPNLIKSNKIVNYINNIDYLIVGSTSENLKNKIIYIHNRISKKFINYYHMSPNSAEIAQYGIEAFKSIKNTFINLFGDIIENLKLTDERNIIIKSIANNSQLEFKSFFYDNLKFDNIDINKVKQLSNIFNLYTKFDFYNQIHSMYNEHLKLYVESLIKKNPNINTPFIFKVWNDSKFEYDILKFLLSDNYNVIIISNHIINVEFDLLIKNYGDKIKLYKKDLPLNGFIIT